MKPINDIRDPSSRQLLQESRIGPATPDDEAACPSQLSSPAKNVHFSDHVVDTAQESANLLRKARSPRGAPIQSSHTKGRSTGKLKRPSTVASTRNKGKMEGSTRLSGKLESHRPRTSESSASDLGSSSEKPRERDDNRERSTPSGNGRTAESEQSCVESVRDGLQDGHAIPATKLSSGDKWTREDGVTLAVLRELEIPYKDIQKVCVHGR